MGDDGNNADFYRPLDSENVEFRLLLLQAGEGDEPAKCQLMHASLKDGAQDRPPYETISYCWGDASKKGAIFLDGLEMEVPLSSATVLRRMRKPKEDRTVWIDAICINQDDVDERGKQVALMKEIYSKTVQNLIWLGEGNEEATEYCFFIFITAYMHAKTETDGFAHFDEITSRSVPTSGLGFPILKHHLIEFFSSPWFERVWIIQEATLAPKGLVHAGSREMDFKKLLISATWIYYKSPLLNLRPMIKYLGLLNCSRMYDLGHRRDSTTMDTILDKLLSFQATNPRDFVYGVLGLYQDIVGLEGPMPALLTPDYNKPVAAVMRDASRYIIEQSDNLDFLRLIRHRPATAYETTNIPSWVEPWHLNTSKFKCAAHLNPTLYAADNRVGKREVPTTITSTITDPDVLSLTGIIVDKVTDRTRRMNGNPNRFRKLFKKPGSPIHIDIIREEPEVMGYAVIAERTSYIREGEALIPTLTPEYARTQVLSWADFILKHKARPRYENMRFGSSNPYTHLPFDVEPEFTEEEWADLVEFDNDVTHATQERRFFRTAAGGHIGLGPRDMVKGDVVAVLYGCRWPVILRPRVRAEGDTVNCYEFIEACYIHGLMDGEAVREHEKSGKEDVVIHLK